MQQTQPAPLSGDVDPEVFRRVWSRVMTDEESSPIAVEEARPSEPEPESSPQPERTAKPEQAVEDSTWLAQILEQLERGLILAQGVTRRAGRHGTALSALVSDYRRAARQLSAAYFLATGERWVPGGGAPEKVAVAQGLRELYWWEREWSGQCLQAAAQAEDSYLQQLFQRLSQTGQIHLGIIRGVLEQMQSPGLDGGRGRGVN